MKSSTKFKFFSLLTLWALLISLVLPLAAFADDGTPPTEEQTVQESVDQQTGEAGSGDGYEPSVVVEQPDVEASPAPAEEPVAPLDAGQAIEEPAATEEAATSESPEAAVEPTIEENTEAATVADVLEAAPEGTQVVVLDENGVALPLVSEAAAQVIATADPIWCPEGAAPVAGAGGCTSSYTSLASLITDLSALNGGTGVTGNGVIWIEDSYVSSVNDPAATDFTLNGTTLTNWNDYNLTIQGGWNGDSLGTITGASTFDGDYLSVINWNADLAIYDVEVINNPGAFGINVDTTADIDLANVESQNNLLGAYLDNSGGTGNVTISGTNDFSDNNSSGLQIYSQGNVSGNNITADGSDTNSGMVVDNTYGSGDVTLTGTNSFNSNVGYGLLVYSNGNIALSNVTASWNTSDGAHLNNSLGAGSVSVDPSTFTYNNGDGLSVSSAGNISLSDVIAEYNDGHGANLNNSVATGYFVSVDPSSFSYNGQGGFYGDGLFVNSGGNISLTDVTADYNYGNGATLDNSIVTGYSVSIDPSSFSYNGQGGSYGDGLGVASGGNISLTDVTAEYNFASGAYLNNAGATGYFVSVDPSSFNYNGLSGLGDGLIAISGGDITLTDVTAENNLGNGATLDNSGVIGYSVSIDPSSFSYNGQGGSYGDGLGVSSGGNISLTDVTADYNYGTGATLNNAGILPGYFVSIDPSSFSHNGWLSSYGDGLIVYSRGDISLTDVTADDNYGNGAVLDNSFVSGYFVSIDPSSFSYNGQGESYGEGLIVDSGGQITLTDVTADYNYGNGATLNNLYVTGYAVSIDPSSFNYNGQGGVYGDGLDVISGGNISLMDVTAEYNFGNGAYLDNSLETGYFVSINPGSFSYNGQSESDGLGLIVYSGGDVTLTDVSASGNFDTGAHLDNRDGTGTISVDPSLFNDNIFGHGLTAFSNGDIMLNEVTASGNYYSGAYLDNSGGTGSISVDPSGFNGNGTSGFYGFGLMAFSSGDITLNEVTASGNYNSGAVLESGGDVDVVCSTFNDNGDYGLEAFLPGTLTLDSNTFSGNVSGDYNSNKSPVFGSTDCEGGEAGEGGEEDDDGPDLPTVIVPVTGGVGFLIDCANPEIFTALLENGDKTLFELLCGYYGLVEEIPQDELPGELPDGSEFVVAHTNAVLDEFGNPVSPLPAGASITPSFIVEDEDAEYAILFWNGDEWVEVEGGALNEDGFFAAEVDYTGTFVLVMK